MEKFVGKMSKALRDLGIDSFTPLFLFCIYLEFISDS